jgi:hypothetical protein
MMVESFMRSRIGHTYTASLFEWMNEIDKEEF